MSKPITVTLPDELHARLQNFKDKMNISQVCQKALDETIKEREKQIEAINQDPEMEEVLARLRKSKAKMENDWYQVGVKAGLHVAKNVVSYEKLRFLATKIKTSREAEAESDHDWYDSLSEREQNLYSETYGDYTQGSADALTEDQALWPPKEHDGEDFLFWEDGFFDSIRRFWDEVKDKI